MRRYQTMLEKNILMKNCRQMSLKHNTYTYKQTGTTNMTKVNSPRFCSVKLNRLIRN